MAEKEFKHLVRIANTDLDGNKPIYKALTRVKGIGFMFSNMLCSLAGIDKNSKTGYLAEDIVKKLDDVIKNPEKFNAPSWMFNRRKDVDDGKDRHIVTSDLKFTQETDVKIMKKIRSYKGMRHAFGLPVRGQRTRSNFRRNKGKVSLGVKKRAGAKSGRT